MSTDEIDKALKSPYKTVKSADREVEFLGTADLMKRKRIAAGTSTTRPLFRQVSVSRTRDLD